MTSVVVSAQNIGLGLRDNLYGWLSYQGKRPYYLKLEQSLFSQKATYQYVRGYVGYEFLWNKLNVATEAYYGQQYNGDFYQLGGSLTASVSFKYIGFVATLNPHYDSTLKYQTCGDIESSILLWKDIAFCMSYGNIPQFRTNTIYWKAGLCIKSGHLEVKPEISIPCFKDVDYLKVYCSFKWRMNLSKKR